MCDYSLHQVASRPAEVGDELITTRFGRSITRGFAAIGEPDVAVCLLPGTELAFKEVVRYEPRLAFFGHDKSEQRVARFRKIDSHDPHAHHDALEFPSGDVVLLTRLIEGQRATVLQLPATPRVKVQAEEHESEPLGA
jgi:hypothetical protein